MTGGDYRGGQVTTGQWLRQAVLGNYQDYAVSENLGQLAFPVAAGSIMALYAAPPEPEVTGDLEGNQCLVCDRWIPVPRTGHPYANVCFGARIQESAVCVSEQRPYGSAGGGRRWPSLTQYKPKQKPKKVLV
jgi:hypothetical protein